MESFCPACWDRSKFFFTKIQSTWHEYTSDGQYDQCSIAQSIYKLLAEISVIYLTKERQTIDRNELIQKVEDLSKTLESFYRLYG